MNIFVTLDRNYLPPLRVMLTSLYMNNLEENVDVWLAGERLTEDDLSSIAALCSRFGGRLRAVEVPRDAFEDAPVIRFYSRGMNYRLLAAQLLPESLDRVLYLDPDILVINRLRPLYGMDMGNVLFAAATHEGLTSISSQVARIRLSTPEGKACFNSGVLLMHLADMRREVEPGAVFRYADQKRAALILPDQDILNRMFWGKTRLIDESLWNYDARKYQSYQIASQYVKNMDWVMQHTAILHYCVKSKPWKKNCRGKFSSPYKHYHVLADRITTA